MDQALEFSVVVPVHNEAGNVAALIGEIAKALDGRAFEMVFVDDASTDDTRAALVALKAKYPMLRVLGHRKNAGQSRAIRSGILAAKAPVIGTLDGDGQNDPADLPDLYRQLTRHDAPEKLKMVMGRRARRKDTAWKRFGSRFANNIRKRMLKDDCDDSGCGIKVMRREAYIQLPYFDHMHRYLLVPVGSHPRIVEPLATSASSPGSIVTTFEVVLIAVTAYPESELLSTDPLERTNSTRAPTVYFLASVTRIAVSEEGSVAATSSVPAQPIFMNWPLKSILVPSVVARPQLMLPAVAPVAWKTVWSFFTHRVNEGLVCAKV